MKSVRLFTNNACGLSNIVNDERNDDEDDDLRCVAATGCRQTFSFDDALMFVVVVVVFVDLNAVSCVALSQLIKFFLFVLCFMVLLGEVLVTIVGGRLK